VADLCRFRAGLSARLSSAEIERLVMEIDREKRTLAGMQACPTPKSERHPTERLISQELLGDFPGKSMLREGQGSGTPCLPVDPGARRGVLSVGAGRRGGRSCGCGATQRTGTGCSRRPSPPTPRPLRSSPASIRILISSKSSAPLPLIPAPAPPARRTRRVQLVRGEGRVLST